MSSENGLGPAASGERLTVDSADKKWPLGWRILFVLVTSFVLWTGIYFTVSSVF
jgi:hypothetical protein